MPRVDIARRQHNRDHLCYPTDKTGREWAVLARQSSPKTIGLKIGLLRPFMRLENDMKKSSVHLSFLTVSVR